MSKCKQEACSLNDKLACGCAVKINTSEVLYPALEKIKGDVAALGYTFAPRDDAFVYLGGAMPKIEREVYDVNKIGALNLEGIDRKNPYAAVTVLSLMNAGLDSDKVERVLRNFYTNLSLAKPRFKIGKGHSIKASRNPEQEFIMMDYIVRPDDERGEKSYIVANNDTMQIIDPMHPPASKRQIVPALNNAMNDLFLMGVYDGIKIVPLYDSPQEDLKDEMKKNIHEYAKQYGFRIVDTEPLNKGMQLIGATAVGTTQNIPPSNYDLSPGDVLYVTRPFGDLIFINANRFSEELKETDAGEIYDITQKVLDLMDAPNIGAAKVIRDFRPEMHGEFDPKSHITATRDITGEGLYSFKELAEDSKVNILIDNIPLHDNEMIERIMNEVPLLPDATSGTAGSIIIGGAPNVMDSVVSALEKQGYKPEMVGRVVEGAGNVVIDPVYEDFLRNIMCDRSRISQFSFG